MTDNACAKCGASTLVPSSKPLAPLPSTFLQGRFLAAIVQQLRDINREEVTPTSFADWAMRLDLLAASGQMCGLAADIENADPYWVIEWVLGNHPALQ